SELVHHFIFFFALILPPPASPLFPYTTLFRSVSSGTAQVERGQEKIDLVQYEQATIPSTGAIQKSAVLKPPELVEPLNLAPIIAENPKTATVHFEWKPVQEAVSYRLRVSTTSMFTRTVVDKKDIKGTSVEVTGLDTGDYFWND